MKKTKKPAKKKSSKKTGRPNKQDQMKADVAVIAEILAIIASHKHNGLAPDLTVAWNKRLIDIRDRLGMQL